MMLYVEKCLQKDSVGMAESIDPDQVAGAVQSGSTLFALEYLSKNLENVLV